MCSHHQTIQEQEHAQQRAQVQVRQRCASRFGAELADQVLTDVR